MLLLTTSRHKREIAEHERHRVLVCVDGVWTYDRRTGAELRVGDVLMGIGKLRAIETVSVVVEPRLEG